MSREWVSWGDGEGRGVDGVERGGERGRGGICSSTLLQLYIPE